MQLASAEAASATTILQRLNDRVALLKDISPAMRPVVAALTAASAREALGANSASNLTTGMFAGGGSGNTRVAGDCNNLGNNSGVWSLASATTNSPYSFGTVIQINQSPDRITQIAFDDLGLEVAVRFLSQGGWNPWRPLKPQRGSNANGEYVRLGDGTQICWVNGMTLTHSSASVLNTSWVYPIPFINQPMAGSMVFSSAGADYVNLNGTELGISRMPFGSTSVVAHVLRNGTIPSFPTNAEVRNVRLTAIGRWYN